MENNPKTSRQFDKEKAGKASKSSSVPRGRKRKSNHQEVVSLPKDTSEDNKTRLANTDKEKSNGPPEKTFPCFKTPQYQENGYFLQTKVWKNLKQIMNTQKSQALPGEITYASIDAPASSKPSKKYSDISGLPALYTDPHTKLRYANSDEYRQIQHLSSDTVTGLLALRKANF